MDGLTLQFTPFLMPIIGAAIVLGAWGCGAFGNDPRVAASAFLRAWPAQAAAFDEVVFAIPNTGSRSAENHRAFRELLRP